MYFLKAALGYSDSMKSSALDKDESLNARKAIANVILMWVFIATAFFDFDYLPAITRIESPETEIYGSY